MTTAIATTTKQRSSSGQPPAYSEVYDPDTDFDVLYTDANFRAIRPYLSAGDTVLELGCGGGLMTSMIVAAGCGVVGVDRVPAFLDAARRRGLGRAEFVEADLCTFDDGRRWRHVVNTHVLHELDDPAGFITHAATLLEPGGLLHLSSPNPRSAHRLLAMEMGWLDDLAAPSDLNRRHAIAGLPGAEQILAWAAAAGLLCLHREGVVFKPLTNDQMATLPADVLEGFVRLARHFPESSAHNFFLLGSSPTRG